MIAPPPDPRQGLFETMLVIDQRPVGLEAHLARLGASAAELFGLELPPDLVATAAEACAGIELGRLRLDVRPGDDGLRGQARATRIDAAEFFPPFERGAELRSVVAPGWSGSHKWSDRAWLEQRERELEEVVPLLVDAGGEVLEAGRANVFAVLGDALVTPPAAGRILPGTARADVLALAPALAVETAERPLALAELHGADGVFLTSSVRGVRPARSLDDRPLRASPLTERVAAALRERWLEKG